MIKTTYVCDRCGLEYDKPLFRMNLLNPDTNVIYTFDVCQKDVADILSQFASSVAVTLGNSIVVPSPISPTPDQMP
jgi:hypothetical protein